MAARLRSLLADTRGTSIIELMMALMISAIIVALMVTWAGAVVGVENHSSSDDKAVQELRVAKEDLSKDIRRCEEILTPSGRVLLFHVPSRPKGILIEVNGRFLMRAGDSLRPMTQDQVRRIVLETEADFSAEPCAGSSIADLDAAAIGEFQSRWSRKAGSARLLELSPERLLADTGLLTGGRPVYAALILFGSTNARLLGRPP